MIQTFSTPNEIGASFVGSVIMGAAVIFLVGAAALVAAWSRHRKLYLKPGLALGLAAFALVIWSSYSASYSRFIEADAGSAELRLRFAGPFAKDVAVAPAAIESVLFGSPGKSNRQCYIRVSLKSGESYSSFMLGQELSKCKKLRQELMQALAPFSA